MPSEEFRNASHVLCQVRTISTLPSEWDPDLRERRAARERLEAVVPDRRPRAGVDSRVALDVPGGRCVLCGLVA